MSETKFTSGEWEVFHPHKVLSSGRASVEDENGRELCAMSVYPSNIVEVTANAHLMKTAPKMYEEIERDIEWLCCMIAAHGQDHPMTPELISMKQDKITLLAEARGE